MILKKIIISLLALSSILFVSCGKLGLKNKKYEGIYDATMNDELGNSENYTISVSREKENTDRLIFENLMGFNYVYEAKVDDGVLFFDVFGSNITPSSSNINGTISKKEIKIENFTLYRNNYGYYKGSLTANK